MSVVQLAQLASQVDCSLNCKISELGKLLEAKTLNGNTNERWYEFLDIVQAHELTSLDNTINYDLVTFIKMVLNQTCS